MRREELPSAFLAEMEKLLKCCYYDEAVDF